MIALVLHPHVERGGFHLDRFDAYLDGEPIVVSRQPLLDGARVLLTRGFGPETPLTMRHAGRDYNSLPAKPIGELAQWTISESDRDGLQRRRWKPFHQDAPGSQAVGSPAADVTPGREMHP